MIIDKPDWVKHNGTAIFSIDVHPDGSKMVTSGSDNKVRIWNMAPILHHVAEADPNIPKALATLSDHYGAVNVARFSPNGKLLASGADDRLVCTYELKPGTGKAAFGSTEAPNIENWRNVFQLRGHDNNVVDLAWSPDGAMVASASLDNLVIIWEAATGRQVTKLQGHHGFVKGVAWDPFNVYVASQGETDGVAVWRVDDWSLATKIKLEHSVASLAFHSRLGWSPDGQHLATVGEFEQPFFVSRLLKRNVWDTEGAHMFVGHKEPVLVVRYNPQFFHAPGDTETAQTVAVIGSGDKRFSVWTSYKSEPLVVGQGGLFSGQVLDCAWTPDGYTLMVCSYDGTIARFSFEEKELGKQVSQAEVQQLFTQLYGSPTVRNKALAASAQLLELEGQAKEADEQLEGFGGSKRPGIISKLNSRLGPASGQAGGLGPISGTSITTGGISGRAAAVGSGQAVQAAAKSADGITKRRIQPAAVGSAPAAPAPAPAAAASPRPPSSPAQRPATAAPASVPDHPPAKRLALQLEPAAAPAAALAPAAGTPQAGPLLLAPPLQQLLSTPLGKQPNPENPDQEDLVVLEANNTRRDHRGRPISELLCSCLGRPIWADRLPGHAICMVGSLQFSAVSTSSGDLQVYSAAGRRMFPPICLGCNAVHMAKDAAWKLLVLTTDGLLRMWDVQLEQRTLEVSVTPILSAGVDGELSKLQRHASAQRKTQDVVGASLHQPLAWQKRSDLAHLEANMAAALALKSPQEWRRWLLTYVHQLSADADEVRLREVVSDLLGPLRWSPGTHQDQPGRGWQPTVLGLDKRKLLRSEVLRKISSNRANQRFVEEVLDMLREVESTAAPAPAVPPV